MTDLDNLDDAPTEPAEAVAQAITRPILSQKQGSISDPTRAGVVRNSGEAPTREMPASQEAEQHVLACCLLDAGETLKRATEAGITERSFYWPANQIVFGTLLALTASNQPVTLETVYSELLTQKLLDAVGGMTYLMQVTSKIPTTAHAGYFIEKVRTLHLLRETIRAATRTVEEAYGYTGGLDEFLTSAEARMSAIRSGSSAEARSDQLKRLKASRIQSCAKPPEPVTRLYLADKPIATPGNLVTMISKAKTGKTAALGAATASIICATIGTQIIKDTFKFRASNPEGHAVIVIDTEQSPYDAWQCYERTKQRAGTDFDPVWLHHHALVGQTVKDMHATLDLLLAECAREHGGIFAVILDGVADFVASVNDEAECNGLVTWLRARTVTYNTPIICVIHSNEAEKSGDDGRGHLGKQLIRKAESNLLLKKDGEVTTITSDKQRKAPITKQDGVAFRWSDEAQMHVSCETGEPTPKGGRAKKANFNSFIQIFPRSADKAMTKQALLRYAQDIADIKETAFRDMLHEAVESGELVRTPRATGFVYHLPVPGPA